MSYSNLCLHENLCQNYTGGSHFNSKQTYHYKEYESLTQYFIKIQMEMSVNLFLFPSFKFPSGADTNS